MRILALDTATNCGGIAILEDSAILASLILNIPKTHSQRLMMNINYLLGECGLEFRDIDAIGVSRGPGSFTGVRIGLACAKGLAFSSGKKIAGVSTLKAMALRSAEPGICLCPVLDARRSEIFGAAYKFDTESRELIEILPGKAEPLESFLEKIEGPALFSGDGSIRFRDAIINKMGNKARFADSNRNLPSAYEVAILARNQILAGKNDNVATLKPIYLREPDAKKPQNKG
jgi:tRNA threonylcarbamoyladenosine biosynthesis protein TsaB